MKTFFYLHSKLAAVLDLQQIMFITGIIAVTIMNLALVIVFNDNLLITSIVAPIIGLSLAFGFRAGFLMTLAGTITGYYYYTWGHMHFNSLAYTRVFAFFILGTVIAYISSEFYKTRKNFQLAKEAIKNERIKAEQANQIKSLFLANMSHEIRTPLTAMLGFTALLKEKDLSESEKRRYFSIIDRTGQNLLAIVNDILDISKIEANRLEIESIEFDLHELIAEIFELMNRQGVRQNSKLEFLYKSELPHMIKSDPLRIRQILINMIGNAIKFCDKGQVIVTFDSIASKLFVTIEDNGIGMTIEQQKNLFETFKQGDCSITRRFAGTGLGLSISRNLANMLGGNVTLISSSPGKGTCFLITISFEEVESFKTENFKPKILLQDKLQLFKDKKLLLVEDNKDNQILIERILKKQGFKVDIANNGEEAITLIYEKNFDLVLMDMQMPVMDGYSATQSLRSKGFNKPIIALTANAMNEDRSKCIEAGCSDYLIKPIHMAEMLNTLYKVLSTTKEVEQTTYAESP